MAAVGTIKIGGEIEVHRLGFGTMRLTGVGIWGPPDDPDECRATLRRGVELGVDFIDTADSYGPYVAEELVGEVPADGGGVSHLEQNMKAADLELTEDELTSLDDIVDTKAAGRPAT